ncbi:hypothetical protein PR048_028934 [Dryococelus australis]|uniref:Uncharacterized protein n=1 Tax=Dryococelus australis TaxID=614101 RepID=A0ABQ9GEP3_9NEOP|nr:hypothetical protein PR048_028934 [Dryococelus australis]
MGRPAASSDTISNCENPGVAWPGTEPGSPWGQPVPPEHSCFVARPVETFSRERGRDASKAPSSATAQQPLSIIQGFSRKEGQEATPLEGRDGRHSCHERNVFGNVECWGGRFFAPKWVELVERDDRNIRLGVLGEGGKTSGARPFSANCMLLWMQRPVLRRSRQLACFGNNCAQQMNSPLLEADPSGSSSALRPPEPQQTNGASKTLQDEIIPSHHENVARLWSASKRSAVAITRNKNNAHSTDRLDKGDALMNARAVHQKGRRGASYTAASPLDQDEGLGRVECASQFRINPSAYPFADWLRPRPGMNLASDWLPPSRPRFPRAAIWQASYHAPIGELYPDMLLTNAAVLLVSVSLLASHQADPGSLPGWVTPDCRMCESCRTMPFVSGFSQRSPNSPALSIRRCSIFALITPHRLSRPRFDSFAALLSRVGVTVTQICNNSPRAEFVPVNAHERHVHSIVLVGWRQIFDVFHACHHNFPALRCKLPSSAQ